MLGLMRRGRQYVPSKDREGHWYRHDRPPIPSMLQTAETITGDMLDQGYNPKPNWAIAAPPTSFHKRAEPNYHHSNKFTAHDNQHVHQGHGVYFGNGRETRTLGRRLAPIDSRLHQSDLDLLHQEANDITPKERYHTLYNRNYEGRPSSDNTEIKRRFPKQYQEPPKGPQPLTTSAIGDFSPPDVPYKTPTSVILRSERRHKPNPWKYSYHSKPDLYPPYDANKEPLGTVLNKHGAAFCIPLPLRNMNTIP